jgi:transcriptional regulator with XRE-family HTH domain
MELYEFIKSRREKLNLSEEELASKIGITLSSYSDLENYPEDPYSQISLGQLLALLDILGVRFAE